MTAKGRRFDRRLLSLQGIERNARQKMDAVDLLSRLPDRIASLFVVDPQYRAVLDKLAFGNEGARQKGRASLPSMNDDQIAFLIEEGQRVLRPSGHLAVWMDKFSMASGHWHRWTRRARHLSVVDMVAWNKLTFGMGRRTRGRTEYLAILQKDPARAKGAWTDHSITDCWTETANQALHPHAKPYQLTERIIRACTSRGDLVVDPCAGSYVVLEACKSSGRECIACDLIG